MNCHCKTFVQSDRAAVISQLKPLATEDKRYRGMLDEKRKELEPLHAALGKLRNASNATREKGVGLCSSEEELNDLVSFYCWIVLLFRVSCHA